MLHGKSKKISIDFRKLLIKMIKIIFLPKNNEMYSTDVGVLSMVILKFLVSKQLRHSLISSYENYW